jgi:hypothetical protein
MLLSASMCPGNSYDYPPEKRPSLSLKEACGIGEKLLAMLGMEREFYILDVSIWGDEKGSGIGTWKLQCRNTEGDEIHMSIHFPEDYCFVRSEPKEGNPRKMDAIEKGFTRDGQISEKWIKMQKSRPAPRPKVALPSQKPEIQHASKLEAEQDGRGDGDKPSN